jgi:phage gp37-like protein
VIAAIEQAMLARLKAASDGGELGYRFRSLDSWGGRPAAGRIADLVRDWPAAWVLFTGEPAPVRLAGEVFRHRPAVSVLVAARGLTDESASRHGRGREPGSYRLIADVRRLLTGEDFGLAGVHPAEPGGVSALLNDDAGGHFLSVYAVEFAVPYDAEPDWRLPPLATVHVDWDVPPAADAPDPLPAADPDAADTVTLQE